MSLLTSTVSTLARMLPSTRENRLLILIFHRVLRNPDPMFPLEAHAERFDWQIRLLRKHCSPVSLADGVRRLREGCLPARAVAVTFDDGYADNASVALPILQRHRVPATFFVSTGFLDGGRMWNDTVIEAVRRASGDRIDLAPVGLGVEALGPEATRGPLVERILRTVKHLHPAVRTRKVEALRDAIGASLPDDLMMTSGQVRSLADAGMEVGAHTVSHPILRSLPAEEARREIVDSRDALQRITGRRIESFAYPNGRPGDDYTERDRDIVVSAGFAQGLSTRRGVAHVGSNVYELPRFSPWDRLPERWLARLLLSYRMTR